ncbi:DUF1320 domain-containing protein [Erwinia psidii]|uniref:gp436 family protein n=1 Tax=Erwinia psidii TaxID=69224 RepID=UPI00226B83DD|nr:phage protein Gp36 family protein [Erwinia psidii]MCX8962139.1 DUF1320 domain-containing protein [Erwinia psidii]
MYATRDDMVTAFGKKECVSLTDRNCTGEIDDVVMNAKLLQASAEINGYIGGRYRLPWSDSAGVLTGRCCDIARYLLCGNGTQCTEEIRERYEDALRYLERIADGKISLGNNDSGAIVPTRSGARFVTGARTFGRDETGGGAF